MSFAELVLFVDGVGYSLAARSRDDMFIKMQCIWGYLLLKTVFRLFEHDMLGADSFADSKSIDWRYYHVSSSYYHVTGLSWCRCALPSVALGPHCRSS